MSVGSTPTALSAESLEGVTEVRAGVYVFFDLVMAGVGVCTREEIAISVLCSVIGHRPDTGWIITDAGWMAMSRDRGTQQQAHDFGYGAVCDVEGRPIEHLAFAEANQEHGVLHWTGDESVDLAQRFPPGSQLRILPNHACATGAQFESYACSCRRTEFGSGRGSAGGRCVRLVLGDAARSTSRCPRRSSCPTGQAAVDVAVAVHVVQILLARNERPPA